MWSTVEGVGPGGNFVVHCVSECWRDVIQVAFQEMTLEAFAAGLGQGGD